MMRYPKIETVMPLSRRETVKRLLYMNDNEDRPDDGIDRLYKIRLFIDADANKVRSVMPGEKIDEEVVPFKGKSRLRQYNPKKLRNLNIRCSCSRVSMD